MDTEDAHISGLRFSIFALKSMQLAWIGLSEGLGLPISLLTHFQVDYMTASFTRVAFSEFERP